MSKIVATPKYALKAAEVGDFVFPLADNTKVPFKGFLWKDLSSNTVAQVEQWNIDHPGCNWAIDLEKSNMTVVDVDCKKGKRGFETLAKLESFYGLFPDTRIVKTPTGGEHIYFLGLTASGNNKLGDDIDIKSVGGYVVLPGSVIDDGSYELVNGAALAPLPTHVKEIAGEPRQKDPDRDIAQCELDLPHHIEEFNDFLINQAKPSIAFKSGNSNAFKVAATGRDLGLSEATIVESMLKHWNHMCEPPWGPEDLENIVRNANRYAQNQPGSGTAEADFDVIEIETETETALVNKGIELISLQEIRKRSKKIDYLVQDYFESNTTVGIYGDSGSFKSFVALYLAMCIATGTELAGKKVKQGAVFYIAGEGIGGIGRRLEAHCIKYNLPKEADIPLFVGQAIQFDKEIHAEKVVLAAKELAEEHGKPVAVIIDTVSTSFGSGDENSARDMNHFLMVINTYLRDPLGCTVFLIHHTGHREKTRHRGSYAFQAGLDALYRIERGKDSLLTCLKRPDKMKDGEPPPDTWFSAEVINIEVDKDLKGTTSLALSFVSEYVPPKKEKQRGVNQRFILSLFESQGVIDKTQAKSKFEKFKTENGVKFNESVFYRTLKDLVKDKSILIKNEKLLLVRD